MIRGIIKGLRLLLQVFFKLAAEEKNNTSMETKILISENYFQT